MNAQEAHVSLLKEALADILANMGTHDFAAFGIDRGRVNEMRLLLDDADAAEQIAARRAEFGPSPAELPLVEFLPGVGTTIMLPVSYIAGFARGPDHRTCAFCQGDPCAEASPPDAPISRFYQDAPRAETCPFCLGRPS